MSAAPVEWLRVGVVGKRTRVFETAAEVDLGPLVGVDIGAFSATAYAFQPWDDDRFWGLSLGVGF